jgi:hypothetical protein
MQRDLLQPSERALLPLGEFLDSLLRALTQEGIRPCILRNYEGFPDKNDGGDVDFLISPSKLAQAVKALRSVEGIRIAGYTDRGYVVSLFVEGVASAPDLRAIQIDFFLRLAWKGVPYLPTDAVLAESLPRRAGKLEFFIPSPIHEALDSLLTGMLIGGWQKEKYYAKQLLTFTGDRAGVIATLQPQFGLRNATRLTDAILAGDKKAILGCIGPLRRSLVLRSILRRPMASAVRIAKHYVAVIKVRNSPATIETACILDATGLMTAPLIEMLVPLLKGAAKFVERHDREFPGGANLNADVPGGAKGGRRLSMTSLVEWLIREWSGRVFGKRNLTLRLYDGYYADVLIDRSRSVYGGPLWFARAVCKLFPNPDVWILLKDSTDDSGSEHRKSWPQSSPEKTDPYLAFLGSEHRYITVIRNRPTSDIVEDTYGGILETLARMTERKLKRRFGAVGMDGGNSASM